MLTTDQIDYLIEIVERDTEFAFRFSEEQVTPQLWHYIEHMRRYRRTTIDELLRMRDGE